MPKIKLPPLYFKINKNIIGFRYGLYKLYRKHKPMISKVTGSAITIKNISFTGQKFGI